MRRIYEVDGTEYECMKAWRFDGEDITEVDTQSISEGEMLDTIMAIRASDQDEAELMAQEIG